MTDKAAPSWAELSSSLPGVATFEAVTAACPADLTPSELPDLIVAADRLICHLQAMQIAAVAEFALPGRCGNLDKLMDGLVDHTGLATRLDGSTDDVALQCLIVERAQSMAAAEIGAALHQSPLGASRRVGDAVELTQELPATLTALRDGHIDLPRARTIAARTALLTPELRSKVEAAVLPLAATRTPGQLTPLIDRRVIAADPAASKKRATAARRDRYVDHTPSVDGMGTIRAHLPAEGAVSVYDLLDRIARATAGHDDRPIAARRADALVDICTQLLTDGYVQVGDMQHPKFEKTGANNASDSNTHTAATDSGDTSPADTGTTAGAAAKTASGDAAAATPDAPAQAQAPKVRLSKVSKLQGRGAHFNLTMSLAAFTQFNSDPAELDGHGIIPAHIAVAIAKSIRSLAVVITNDQGHATAVGATTYLPTQLIRDQVITAAGTCRFPSCRIGGRHCDLDHRTPYNHHNPAQGGHTAADCLDTECRHHHLLRTFTGWHPRRDPADGLTMHWTSPTHHHYLDHPKEHALPEGQHTEPNGAEIEVDPDVPQACTCTCGHGNTIEASGSTAHTQAAQALVMIERQKQRELEAEETREQQRLFLANRPRFVHYLGPTPPPWPEDDRTDEEFQAEVEAVIATYDSWEHYKTTDRKFNQRVQPMLYAIQMAAEYKQQHPDPDEPPF